MAEGLWSRPGLAAKRHLCLRRQPTVTGGQDRTVPPVFRRDRVVASRRQRHLL